MTGSKFAMAPVKFQEILMFVPEKMPNIVATKLEWTHCTIELCRITALFGVFLERNIKNSWQQQNWHVTIWRPRNNDTKMENQYQKEVDSTKSWWQTKKLKTWKRRVNEIDEMTKMNWWCNVRRPHMKTSVQGTYMNDNWLNAHTGLGHILLHLWTMWIHTRRLSLKKLWCLFASKRVPSNAVTPRTPFVLIVLADGHNN